jgi:hypothetical protein
MGVYVCLLYFGALLSPILGGYIYTGLGWKAIIVSEIVSTSGLLIVSG